MADVINGFFGQASGPFKKNTQIFNILNQQSGRKINYISKIGIYYATNFDLDIKGEYFPQINVKLNNIEVTLGKMGILELEDCRITSIQFTTDVNNHIYIDYQYK